MEYERIHKPQTGIISPSKFRMKLMGHHKEGSNSHSERTSPSKLEEDNEFVRNSLLASNAKVFYNEVATLDIASIKLSGSDVSDIGQGDQNSSQQRRDFLPKHFQQFSKTDIGNPSSVHPMRTPEDDLDYDSNTSSSSFECHNGDRLVHNPIGRSLLRPMSSKWNDAEKWIMNRQIGQANHLKKHNLQSQASRVMNGIRVAPECASYDNKSSVKRVDFCQPASHMSLEKFSFISAAVQPISGQGNGTTVPIDLCPQISDLKEVDSESSSFITISASESPGPAIRSVCMRDMGTEMTPIPSNEPSRTATPVGATTPLRSPTSSLPSTPRRGAPTSKTAGLFIDGASGPLTENGTKELSEQELKLKTRKEILALGVQLGKMNIAAWASKDEDKNFSVAQSELEEIRRIEFEKRASAWEEAEKSKLTARFKREEIKIQAWESRQKTKFDAEMRKIEVQVEQITAQAQAKMVKKIAMARQKSDEKRGAAESKKTSHAEKLSAQAEYIHQTGRIPSSSYMCCGWS